jgi:hypothetical protein
MLFHIFRRSTYLDEPPIAPIPEATLNPSFVETDDLPYTRWQVGVSTLEDLIRMVADHGEIVIDIENGMPRIEIYDNYRE